MKHIFTLLICIAFALTGCGNNENNQNTTDAAPAEVAPPAKPESNLGENGTAGLMNLVRKYFSLKNALVATNAGEANTAASQLDAETAAFATALQTDSAQASSLKPYLDTIAMQSKAITTLKDETCEQQRIAFEKISSSVYGLAKTTNLKNARVYHQYCPMAFNDKGAFWLSDNSEIKNPYFGKKMLECGEVTDSL